LWGQVGENKINLQDLQDDLGQQTKFNFEKKSINMAANITTDALNMKETNAFASKALQ
jgi:hypothetical protein